MIEVDEGVALADATRAKVAGWIERMVAAASLTEELDEELEASFRFVGDAAMTELNRAYRDASGPTDVLAFAQREGAAGALFPHLLGDVVISVDTAARQAEGALEDELLVLAAHGLCHLLGYDHQNDAQDLEMKTRMAALIDAARADGPIVPA